MNKIKILLLLVFLKSLSLSIYAQNDLKSDTIFARKIFNEAIEFSNAEKFDNAVSNYLKAAEIYLRLTSNLSLPKNWASERFIMTLDNLTSVFMNQTNYETAIDASDIMINHAYEAFGERSYYVSKGYIKKGLVFQKLEQYDNAIEYFLKALSIRIDLFGTNSLEVGSLNNIIGNVYIGKGEYDTALDYHLMVLSILKIHEGEDDLLLAISYNNIGDVYNFKNNYKSALNYYLKSLTINKSKLGELNLSVAHNFQAIGNTYKELAEYDKALEFLGKSLQVTKNILGEENYNIASLYRNLGSIYCEKQENDSALRFYSNSLAILQKIYTTDNAEVAKLYNDIGIVYVNKGNYPLAFDNFSKSLNIVIKVFGEKHFLVLTAYNNIGTTYRQIGQNSLALEYLNKSLNGFIGIYGKTNPEIGTIYLNIGAAYQDQGKHTLALKCYEEALSIFTKIYGAKHPTVAKAYGNIATIYDELGDYQKVVEYQMNSINIEKEIFGENNPSLALSYNNGGYQCIKIKEYERALRFFKDAIKIYKASIGEKNPDIALTYNGLGDLYYVQGKYDLALMYYQKGIVSNVMNFNDSSNVKSNPLVSKYLHPTIFYNSLFGKVNSFCRLNDYDAALQTLQVCDSIVDILKKSQMNESDKLTNASLSNSLYDMAIQICLLQSMMQKSQIERNNYFEKAFLFSEKSKAGVLLEALAGQESLKFAGIPDSLLQLEHELTNDISSIEKNIIELPDTTNEIKYRNQLFKLNRQYEELIARIEKEYPDYYNLKYSTQNPTVKEIQNTLDDKTGIRSYFVGDSNIFIFTLSKKILDVTHVPIIKSFTDSITWFRYGLTKTSQRMQEHYRRIGYLLYQQLFPESAPIDSQIKNLIIIPDGILAIIPYECLLTTNYTGDIDDYKNYPFLIKEFNISYSYSANLFYRTFSKQKTPSIEITKMSDWLAFAPVFDNSRDKLLITTRELQMQLNWLKTDSLMTYRSIFDRSYISPLPSTATETENIFKLYEDNNLIAKVLLYKNANEQIIKSGSLEDYKILHFATHGFVNSEYPELSGILLAQDTTGGEDGILYSGEIYNLKLKADLVVLSACETGLGKIQKGEGIIGLTRALLYAGAKNIIVSLWQVGDQSTSDLMVDFYKSYLDNKGELSYSKAIRNAKLKMISEGRFAHPLYWSPFILIGQ